MNTAIIDIAGHRAGASIRTGQQAWSQIRATVDEQRTLWLEVGVALMYGKQKNNRAAGQKFSDWVQEMFPGLDMRDASDAQWFAENSDTVTDSCTLSHPRRIREAHNEQQSTAALPADAPEVSTVSAPKFASKRDAESFIKLDQRAESKDEGSETATRMRKAVAAKHGTTVEDLRKEASATAPDEFYRFTPTALKAIDAIRLNLRGSAAAMELSGIPKEAIRDIFFQFTNSL